MSDGQATTLMDLADFLADKVKESSYRAVAEKVKISRGAIEKIAKRQIKEPPELDTLYAISEAYDLPLWHVIEMAGYDLGLSSDPSSERARLVQLVDRVPELKGLLKELLDLSDSRRRIALGYIESYLRFQAEQNDDAKQE